MKEFTCRVCKKVFYRWASTNAKYCSRKCYLIDHHIAPRAVKAKKVFICKYCGKEFEDWKCKNRKLCSKSCKDKWISENIRGKNHKLWKGGYTATNGYRYIQKNGKWETEHRLVMEKMLGRKLNELEVVHHIDGDRLNNNADNLLVMGDREHRIYHGLSQSKLYKRR